MNNSFCYATALSRNTDRVTTAEQAMLRQKRVTIAGMGGVGGVHLLTLRRPGIQAFHIADFDTFAIERFNRQGGATNESNLSDFFTGLDLHLDGLDFFAFSARQATVPLEHNSGGSLAGPPPR